MGGQAVGRIQRHDAADAALAGFQHVVDTVAHGHGLDLPAEHRAVEGLRAGGVGAHQVVPAEAAVVLAEHRWSFRQG